MNESNLKIDYVGIDVSKHTLEVAWDEASKTCCYRNNAEGISSLLAKLKKRPEVFIIIEPTGGYETYLEQACDTANIKIISVLANRVRDFAKASGQLAKNDRIDAKILLSYARAFKLTAEDISMRKSPEIKALMARRDQLVKLIAQEKNHLESTYNASMKERIKAHIKFLESELKAIEKALTDLIAADKALREKSEVLQSIKGVGEVLTLQSLSQLPELGLVSNKEIAALVGVAPYVRESGQYRGQARIYGGRSAMRKILYMACLSARQHNPSIKTFYEHLRGQGKPYKVAMVACMRKLIIIMNCVCREMRPWKEKLA